MLTPLAILVSLAAVAMQAAAQDGLPIVVANGRPASPPGIRLVDVTLRFDAQVPAILEIVQLARQPGEPMWRVAGASRVEVSLGGARVSGASGQESLLVIRAPDHAGYLLDGPFRWPAHPATYVVRAEWRRTVRGRFPTGGGSLTWIGVDDSRASAAPTCSWTSRADWECVGVPLDLDGVVLGSGSGELLCGIPSGPVSPEGVQRSQPGTSSWGRLLVVTGQPAAARGSEVRVRARKLTTPRARPHSLRLEDEPESRVRVDAAGRGAFWLSGFDVEDDAWIEVGAAGRATERLDVRDVAGAPPDLPMRIHLDPSEPLSGRVATRTGVVAADSVVALYRFTRDRSVDDTFSGRPQKRVSVGETRADADGLFRFDDLGRERHEIVAMHPSFGRGEALVEPGRREIDIVLRSPVRAVGRVVRGGAPASDIPVAFMPALDQFAAAADVTELRGGETATDADGVFSVLLGFRGAGELRVGDVRSGMRRVPLGAAESLPDVVQVGTIELNALPPVLLAFEGAGSCELLMTGPAARSGLSVVRASRVGPAMFQAVLPEPGRWHVVAVCGRRERAVVPPALDVPARGLPATVRLSWP